MSHAPRAWFRRSGRQSKSSSDRLSSRRRRPLLEALEDRTLLSISVPPPGRSGPVTITGTPGNDQFMIRLLPSLPPGNGGAAMVAFSDNGGTTFTSVPLANVTSVTINGMGGFDSLVLDIGDSLVGKAGGLAIT